MADIFVSYARQDKARVAPLVAALKAQGWSVWWDPAIVPGEEFDSLIRSEIDAASAVIVVWTPASIASRWVRGEARLGAERGILVPVRFERAQLPIDAMAIHTTDLDDWKEDAKSGAFQELLGALSRHLKDVARAPAEAERRTSICVLPFANMSDDPQQEYFSDGISEDIITDLSKVSSLSVIARNTAFTFKGKHVDVPQVAKQLKVNHVLEGSVRKSGNRVRITAQLIDGINGDHLWAERYDRNLDDIFALQDEISQAIVAALRLTLFPQEKKAIEDRGTTNVEAYDIYLRARALNANLTGPEVKRSLDLYRKAIALDPNFAQAWAGLGSALGGSFIYFPETIAALRVEMDNALARAEQLMPDLIDVHAALILQGIMQRDWASVEKHSAAIPLGAIIPQGISGYLQATLGRANSAVEQRLREREHDPLSLGTSFGLQLALDLAGRYAEAEAEYERSKDLHGNRASLEWRAATRMWAMNNEAGFKKRFEFYVSDPSFMAFSPQIAKVLGEPEKVLAIIRAALKEPFYQDGSRMGMLANWAAHYGDSDLALKALRRGYVEMRGLTLVELWHPVFAEVRKDPRFKEIVRDIGLADHWRKTGKWGDFARPLGDNDFEVFR